MTDWTRMSEDLRKELVKRLRKAYRSRDDYHTDSEKIKALINELDPPPLSDAEKLEAIREVLDTPNFQRWTRLVAIRAILEGKRP